MLRKNPSSRSTKLKRVASPRRRTELGLLMLAAVVTIAAYALASLGKTASIPANILPFFGIILALELIAHVANRYLAPNADSILLPLAALLNGLGYVMITRLDYHLASRQAVWTALGVVVYVLTLLIVRHSNFLSKYRYLLALSGIILLILPLAPVIGSNINGARLWIVLGPITFQPVELAKIALAIFFASYLVEKQELLRVPTARLGNFLFPSPRALAPVLAAWGLSIIVMVAEHDIGFSLLIFVLFISMLWVATGRAAYLIIAAVLFTAGMFIGMALFAHVVERISIWLNPWPHQNSTGYQLIQGLFALASGGLSGTGLGLGHPQLIPVVVSDFIFAAIGEEMGLLGTSAIVICFVLIVGTGFKIALKARSEFPKLLAVGLTTTIGFQAFFIMAGIVRLLPLTGVTLPFVAYGGSSLLANYVLIALLMRISAEANDAPPMVPQTYPSEITPAWSKTATSI